MAKTPEFNESIDYKKNYIINGNFDFWQRGTSGAITTSILYTCVDRWKGFIATTNVGLTHSRNTDVPSSLVFPATYSLNSQNTLTNSPAVSDYTQTYYAMEGYDFANLSGKYFTLSFWAKSNLTGDFGLSLSNNAGDRSYVTKYSISQADTWEFKTITIKHDSSGTWTYDNSAGIFVRFALATGTNFKTATLDQWQSGNYRAPTTQVNFYSSTSNYLRLSQVMLNEGVVASPFTRCGDTIQEELALCQRYYQKSYFVTQTPGISTQSGACEIGCYLAVTSGNYLMCAIRFPVHLRTTPNAVNLYDATNGSVLGNVSVNGTTRAAIAADIGSSGFGAVQNTSGVTWTDQSWVSLHYTTDAEI